MGELIRIVGGRVVDAAISATLMTGVVCLAMITTRQPSRRRALARAGVLGALLAIPLVYLRPFEPIDLVNPIAAALGPTLAWIAARFGRTAPTVGASGFGLDGPLARWLPAGMLAAYLAGVALGLGRMAVGWLGAGWIGRHSRPPSPEAAGLAESLPFAAGRARPRLRVSDRTRRPVLLGMFRPTILIPPALDRPEAAESLRLALLHELAHAEASDPWFALAIELASAFWFWLPPLWWLRRQMRLDQEFLADRHASGHYGPTSRYATTLVAIAATAGPDRDDPGRTRTGAGPGPGSALFQRVLMLVRCPFPIEGRPPRWWRATLGAGTGAVLLVATGLTLRATTGPAGGIAPPPCRSLFMARAIVQDAPAADAPAVLPIRLPESFDLSFEVKANAAELAALRVLGRPLGPEPVVANPLLADPPRWHRVQIRRRCRELSMAVDSSTLAPAPGPSSDQWLSVEGSPERRTVLRSLQLSW